VLAFTSHTFFPHHGQRAEKHVSRRHPMKQARTFLEPSLFTLQCWARPPPSVDQRWRLLSTSVDGPTPPPAPPPLAHSSLLFTALYCGPRSTLGLLYSRQILGLLFSPMLSEQCLCLKYCSAPALGAYRENSPSSQRARDCNTSAQRRNPRPSPPTKLRIPSLLFSQLLVSPHSSSEVNEVNPPFSLFLWSPITTRHKHPSGPRLRVLLDISSLLEVVAPTSIYFP